MVDPPPKEGTTACSSSRAPDLEEVVSPTRSRFAIEPLEPGFGYTVGNSLRRTLLSSIPGTAISSVRIDGVLHEFSTVPKVTEDVTDVILNLKELVARSELEEPTTVKAKGPAEVTAGDIAPPAGVEILNPDLHIATLGKGASLEMEMTVDAVGYRMADKNKPRDPIGVIPVDSIFSPVRKVSYTVENTRVEQMTDRDRLILDVETDGSVTPREAVASAGGTLLELVTLFSELAEAASVTVGPAEDDEVPGDYAITIEELNLSVRSYNCLKREGIQLGRRRDPQERVRAHGHPELRPEVDRRGEGQARGAGSRTAGGVTGAQAQEGPRLGSNPGHQRLLLSTLAAQLFTHEAIDTTEAKAKALRPYAEKLITKAKKGDLAARRDVLKDIPDRDVVARLFRDRAALRRAQRGTRILKLGPRKGDAARWRASSWWSAATDRRTRVADAAMRPGHRAPASRVPPIYSTVNPVRMPSV